MSAREVLHFTKMHGLGNDYVFVDLFKEKVAEPKALSIEISNRHFGVGADGLILIGPSKKADVSMRVFNADGSEAEMCGNGIRCVAKYAYEHRLAKSKEVRVETPAGVKNISVTVEGGKVKSARVDMDKPLLLRKDIPMSGPPDQQCVDAILEVQEKSFSATCLSMGNPHCVIFVDNVDDVPLENLGPAIENHEAFPERINVHFVQLFSLSEVKMRTWERGSGITQACGSGASAVCVAGALTDRTERRILAHLPGGDLELEWAQNDHVFMTGPAAEAFTGEWPI